MKNLITRSSLAPWQKRALAQDFMGDFFSDFDRAFGSLLNSNSALNEYRVEPEVNVHETEDHFLLSFDFPGVKKEDIHVEVKDNVLSVTGERISSTGNRKGVGRYQQSLTLPTFVQADRVEAHYENGVLNVALPKVVKAEGKKVEVQSGESNLFGRLLGSLKSKE